MSFLKITCKDCFSALLLLYMSSGLKGATFEILFPVSDYIGYKSVYASDDGSIVLGADTNQHKTYLWDQGVITIWNDLTTRTGMSGDGQTILTHTYQSGFFPYDASYDGSVIVGSNTGKPVVIINGQQLTLQLFPGDNQGLARAVSSNGTTTVGSSYRVDFSTGARRRETPFRWTADGGMVSLGLLPSAAIQVGRANDVSGDGSIIVGYSYTSDRKQEAFRWSESTGMQALGDLPGGFHASEAFAVSGDGRVIVGRGHADAYIGGGVYDNGAEAIIWTETEGMQDLRELLINTYGLSLHDYRLRAATGLTADGNIIVGVGLGSDGNFAWRVNLIPEPSAPTILASLAVLRLWGHRRRSWRRKHLFPSRTQPSSFPLP